MFKSRSKVLFVGSFLATAYIIYLMIYFGGSMSSSDATEALGGAIATALVMPHMLITGLGVIFSWVGFFARKPWGALVGAILYCVGAVLFLIYAIFSIPLIVLGFIGFAKQKKLINNNNN